MKMRRLGRHGPEVSAIALGCMSFAGFYGKTTRDESFATLDAARDAGITLLDTAELYGKGQSEQIIGDWMKDRGHRFHIATKGGIVLGGARGENNNSEPHLRRALEGSLTRLGVDQVALYYVHRRDWSLPVEEVTETLEGFRQEGLIGGFGFSEIAPTSLRRAASVAPVMAVQNEYSLWSRQPELGLIRACRELGTTFVPFSPLARGMFSDTPPTYDAVQAVPFLHNNPRFVEPAFSANQAVIERFRDLCRLKDWSVPAAALAWILDQGDHLIPIPGTRTADHLRNWTMALDIQFTDTERGEIDQIMPPGWAEGDRYSDAQIVGIERYC